MFDEGHMTDGLGRTINFKNTIIIMTSNAGVSKAISFGNSVGFSTSTVTDAERQKNIIKTELKKYFKPEFLNRIDDTVFFNDLSEDNIFHIVGLQFKELTKRMTEVNFEVTFAEGVDRYIRENGYDKDMGARPMQRAIQKLIEDPISDALLNAGMPDSGKITVKMKENKESVEVEIF
jgi:ATP-dependent Clp protease ATP-binding subunit ClpC